MRRLSWKVGFCVGMLGLSLLESCCCPCSADSERLAQLRQLLHGNATEKAFARIMRLFIDWPEGAERQQALKEAVHALESWPDAVRGGIGVPYVKRDGAVSDHAVLLRSLVLYRHEQHGNKVIVRVSNSPYLSNVTRLSIQRCELSTAPLARSPYLRSLTHLTVSKTVLTAYEFQELMASKVVSKLTHMTFHAISVHKQRLKHLIESAPAPHLQHLAISWSIGDEEALMLAQATHMVALERLDLRHNFMSERGRRLLKEAPHLQRTELLF